MTALADIAAPEDLADLSTTDSREHPGAGVPPVVGPPAGVCLAAADELATHDVPVTVVDPQWTAPPDPCLPKLSAAHHPVPAVEGTTVTGALGGRPVQAFATTGERTRVATFTPPSAFLPHAPRAEIPRAPGPARGSTTTVLKRPSHPEAPR